MCIHDPQSIFAINEVKEGIDGKKSITIAGTLAPVTNGCIDEENVHGGVVVVKRANNRFQRFSVQDRKKTCPNRDTIRSRTI